MNLYSRSSSTTLPAAADRLRSRDQPTDHPPDGFTFRTRGGHPYQFHGHKNYENRKQHPQPRISSFSSISDSIHPIPRTTCVRAKHGKTIKFKIVSSAATTTTATMVPHGTPKRQNPIHRPFTSKAPARFHLAFPHTAPHRISISSVCTWHHGIPQISLLGR